MRVCTCVRALAAGHDGLPCGTVPYEVVSCCAILRHVVSEWGMGGRSTVRRGRHGKAWRVAVQHGKAWRVIVRHGKAWRVVVQHSKA